MVYSYKKRVQAGISADKDEKKEYRILCDISDFPQDVNLNKTSFRHS